jgi:hypothetical protein
VEIIGLGLVTDGQGGMAAASVSLSRAAKLRKRVILSAPTRSARRVPAHFLYGQGNARRPEGIVLVAVSLLRGGVSCNKGCIGWTTIP